MIAAVALWLLGVVDQVDNGVALVEWEGAVFGTVDVADLPRDTHEGDRVRLRVTTKLLKQHPTEDGDVSLLLDLEHVRARVRRLPRGARRPSTQERS